MVFRSPGFGCSGINWMESIQGLSFWYRCLGRRMIKFGKREKSNTASHQELLCKMMSEDESGIGGNTFSVRKRFSTLRTKKAKKRLERRPVKTTVAIKVK